MTTTPTLPPTPATPDQPRTGRGRAVALAAAGLLAGAVVTGAAILGLQGGHTTTPAATPAAPAPVVVHVPTEHRSPAIPARPVPAAPEPSAAVATLQRELGTLNYYEGPVTGTMNTQTVQAITYLQRDAHLPQTGVMNPATQQALVTMLAQGNNQMGG